MLEKLKQKAVKMNFKKMVVGYLLTGIIASAISGVLLYNNFSGRVRDSRAVAKETRQEYEAEWRENLGQHFEDDWDIDDYFDYLEPEETVGIRTQMYEIWKLGTADYILLSAISVLAFAFAVTYWLLCIIWAVRKAESCGTNTAFWAVAALVFNLWAVAALYLYVMLKGTCEKCGYIIARKEEMFCRKCGAALRKKCPECEHVVKAGAGYCPDCGKKLDKAE